MAGEFHDQQARDNADGKGTRKARQRQRRRLGTWYSDQQNATGKAPPPSTTTATATATATAAKKIEWAVAAGQLSFPGAAVVDNRDKADHDASEVGGMNQPGGTSHAMTAAAASAGKAATFSRTDGDASSFSRESTGVGGGGAAMERRVARNAEEIQGSEETEGGERDELGLFPIHRLLRSLRPGRHRSRR